MPLPQVTERMYGIVRDPITNRRDHIRAFTLTNVNNYSVKVMNLGATVTHIYTLSKDGLFHDIVLGFDTADHYVNPKENPYFGATVGRVANRISNARFVLNGEVVELSKNHKGKHTLHGGFIGLHNVIWRVVAVKQGHCSLELEYVSKDGHEGFPGTVSMRAHFQLTPENALNITYTARTTERTPINFTNHSYFNLAGHHAGQGALFDHYVTIKADRITVTNDETIPTGELMDVEGTPYDLREMIQLGACMMQLQGKGFDDYYCVKANNDKTIQMVAKAYHPPSGRWMEVSTDQPGVLFYTGNYLPSYGAMQKAIYGKNKQAYVRQCAFCFETQGYPDAVNQTSFPTILVRPGEVYTHHVSYKFGVTYS